MSRKRWMRWLRVLGVGAVIAYTGVGVIIGVAQDALIYPGRHWHGTPAASLEGLRSPFEAVTLTSADGTRLAGAAAEAESAGAATMLFFYGNGEYAASALDRVRMFRSLAGGCNVLVIDYPGYGASTGSAGETAFHAAADAAWAYAASRWTRGAIYITGQSMGTAVATHLAARHTGDPRLRGVILIAPFTSIADIAQDMLPIYPARWMLRSPFDNRAAISEITAPVLVIHGTEDNVVPPAMGQTIANLAGAPYVAIQGGGHNDLFYRHRDKVLPAIAQFLERNATAQGAKTTSK